MRHYFVFPCRSSLARWSRRTLAPLGLLLGATCAFSLSGDLPTLHKVNVEAAVSRDSSTGIYYYDYSLTNDKANRGEIEELSIVIWRDSASTIAFDTSGLQFAGRRFAEESFRNDFAHLGPWIVPVGFARMPSGWIPWSGGNRPYASTSKDRDFIKPGQGVDGIVIMSRGLPGVRQCEVKPDFNVDRYLPNEDDVDVIDSVMQTTWYEGLTVGPWSPPAKFDAFVFLDTLSSFVREARRERWITFDQAAERYTRLFDRAKTALRQSMPQTVSEVLRNVLAGADDDKGKTLKPEADALIRYNTEYLLNALLKRAK
ncbi:MAG TPA: hypothetical protein VL221_10170 [Bacteroidota bacterium]|nr:hypothetical protein [Bacteroidota bacterium]